MAGVLGLPLLDGELIFHVVEYVDLLGIRVVGLPTFSLQESKHLDIGLMDWPD